MTDVLAAFDAFLGSPEGQAVKALLIGTLLVFALGVLAALRDGTFNLGYIDSFVRSTIWGRVAPVLTFLFLGYVSAEPLISGPAIVAAGAVALGMIASAVESIRQMSATKEVSAAANTPPVA